MKIEPGKYYKTRDGRKAWVGHICPEESGKMYSVYGYTVEEDGEWYSTCWLPCGTYRLKNTSVLDLVSEWTEPKLERKFMVELMLDVEGNYAGVRVGELAEDGYCTNIGSISFGKKIGRIFTHTFKVND